MKTTQHTESDTSHSKILNRINSDSVAVKKAAIRALYYTTVQIQFAWIFGSILTCLMAGVSVQFAGFSSIAVILLSYVYLWFAIGVSKVEAEVYAVQTSAPLN